MQFQQDFNRKGTQGTQRQELTVFFFAIFAFFVVNSALVAACRAGPLAPFCGYFSRVPSCGLLCIAQGLLIEMAGSHHRETSSLSVAFVKMTSGEVSAESCGRARLNLCGNGSCSILIALQISAIRGLQRAICEH